MTACWDEKGRLPDRHRSGFAMRLKDSKRDNARGSVQVGSAERRTRRIVHVAARYPPALGGMEQVVQSLARLQHQLGMDVEVVTSNHATNGSRCEDEPFPVARLRSADMANTTIMPGLLRRLSPLSRDALIHLHISSAYTPEMVWLHARRTGAMYLAHVHIDFLASSRAGVLLGPYKKLILRRVLCDATAVLVPTDDYRILIAEKYGIAPQRILVIRNGTDHEITESPRQLSLTNRKRQLIFVGRLSVQKNIPLMLDAMAAYVRRYGRDVGLVIVGDGETRADVRARITRLGLSDIVTLSGPKHGQELQSAYEQSDLLLLTSTNESFGLVLIEAMTKGLPIVSVNIPAVRNVVANGVNGILADPKADSLADAVNTLLANQDLYAMVSRNNLRTARGYGWQAVAQDMAAIYNSL